MSGVVRVRKNRNFEPLYSELLNSDNPAFTRLVDKFIAYIPEYLKDIERAMCNGDFAELKSILHNIKGVSGNYGYPQLSEECKQAEKLDPQNLVELKVIVENINVLAERIMLVKKSEQ